MIKTLTVNINGQDKTVQAEIVDKKLWFKIDDNIYSQDLLELGESGFKKSKASTKSPHKILAPMPGKVTKLFIGGNQAVGKGDPLLVMEAMKMEYTLKADLVTTVEKILINVGDQVTLGQLLIQLKEIK